MGGQATQQRGCDVEAIESDAVATDDRRPLTEAERQLAAVRAFRFLSSIVNGDIEASVKQRVDACEILCDRVWGRPKTTMDTTVRHDGHIHLEALSVALAKVYGNPEAAGSSLETPGTNPALANDREL
jgi:hypothetical protein